MQNTLGQIVLLVVILAALAFFSKEIWLRFRLIRAGKHDEKRWDRPWERLGHMAYKVGTQLCSIKDRPIVGIMHAFVFWGFVFFTVATLNHVVGAFHRGFSLWGKGLFNDLWFLGVDFIAILTLVGTIYLAVRRFIFKPTAITKPMPISKSPQSAIVLSLIFGLMLTYLLNQGAEIVLHNGVSFSRWMPFSKATSALFAGTSSSALELSNQIFWWSHILMVLGFLVFIPHSKHLHLLAGPINMFFRPRQSIGTLQKVDFEKTEQFGATLVTDLQWKNIMDFFSCVDCGRCQDVCPAYQSGKALSPKVVMMSLRKHTLNEAANLTLGKPAAERMMDKWQTPDEIWACTTCGACMEACPVANEHIPTILELRRAQMMMDNKFPSELNATFKGLETNANPWNLGADGRALWSSDLNVPIMAEVQEAEYLWFVGCSGSFDDRGKEISKSFVKILQKAGISFAILGAEEKCCGDPARRAGNEYLFQMIAEENIKTFQQYKFKKILTSCPHGFHMIKHEYHQFGGHFDVVHHSELIAELISSGKIKVNPNGMGKVTYHDSCYLGRCNGLYDPPREILRALQADGLVEMPRSRNKSFCCGAGGARMFMEETQGERINQVRVAEAAGTGAKSVAVACPFCLTMFDDGIKEKGLDERLQVLDLAQVVATNMV